jgi:predicted transposase YdaD
VSKVWDTLMKLLVGANRQQLVTLLLPGAKYVGELNTELQGKTLNADLLYNIRWNGKRSILHVEFQKRRDSDMGRRLWAYNALTVINTGLPVCSFVIYLKKDGNVAQSPYKIELPDDEVSHHFTFRTVKLWELPADVFKRPGVEGLLPLLPLARNNDSHAAVEDMIASLNRAGKNDLLPLGYTFASMILETPVDKQWLKERFALLRDIIEESWAYQEMAASGLQEGLEKGRQQGLQQGLEEGEIRGLREAITLIVQGRFPGLVSVVQKRVNALEDAVELRELIAKINIATTASEVEEALTVRRKSTRKRK